MNQEQVRHDAKYLVYTFFLAVLILGASLKTILTEPAEVAQTAGQRQPANVSFASGKTGGARSQAQETLNWDCKTNKFAPVDNSHIRLKGRHCQPMGGETLRVHNKTNGYTAAVFHDKRNFSTDFIDLSEGENILVFEWKIGNKSESREVKILRQPAQSEVVLDGRSN